MKKIKKKIKRIIEKVEYFFRSVKYGTENLIKWFPVVWKDRDWDHWFLYVILQFKLKQMEKLQRKYGHGLNSEDYANQMRTCILLLDRLIKDDYLENVLKPHEEKWGETTMDFKATRERDDLYEAYFKTEKAITKKQKEQEHKERMRLYKHEGKLKQQDLDYLFKYMHKHILGWWD